MEGVRPVTGAIRKRNHKSDLISNSNFKIRTDVFCAASKLSCWSKVTLGMCAVHSKSSSARFGDGRRVVSFGGNSLKNEHVEQK